MAQTTVNLTLDEKVLSDLEQTCNKMGMSISTAFTIFAVKVAREKRIPFEITADPFYSESNMKYLEKVISDIEEGRAELEEHELIETEDEEE